MTLRMSAMLLVLTAIGCATRPPRTIQVEAEVVQFLPGDHHMHWDDGRWATYDVVQFRLLSPPDRAGESLPVSIQPDSTNAFLRVKGTRCTFRILQELFTPSGKAHQELFEGALRDLKKNE